MSLRLLMMCFLISSVTLLQARRNADEIDPADFAKKVTRTYTSLVNDSLIKKGQIQDFLKRPEFNLLSEKDYNFINKALVNESLLADIRWELQGSRIILNDKRIYKSPVEIDFRDYTKKDSSRIYINNKAFDLKFLSHSEAESESQILEQMQALEKFMATQELHAYFPSLNDTWAQGLFMAGKLLFFPLTMLTACTEKQAGSGNGFLANVGIYVNNAAAKFQKFFENGPSNHDARKKVGPISPIPGT